MSKKIYKRIDVMKKILGGASAAITLAIPVILAILNKESLADDALSDNITPETEKKSYNGYMPAGCRACGGPYPLCRDGCPIFDD